MCTSSWIWGGVGFTVISSARRLLGSGERVTMLGNPRGTSKASEGMTRWGSPIDLPCPLGLGFFVRRAELAR
jgi:hypothetical protein